MRTLLNDLAYALRQMHKSPGFTLVAIITLALGIGANAAIFTLVHAILLRPLPVKNPSALYRLGSHDVSCCVTSGFQDDWDLYSNALYLQIKRQTPEFEDLAALRAGIWNISVRRAGENSPALPMHDEYVSGNYFSLFGVRPALGRLLTPSDDQRNSAPAAVMSYRAWQNYFASDPSIVGSTVAIDGIHVTVVGIAAAEFFGDRLTDTPPDFWLPLAIEPAMHGETSLLDHDDLHWLYLMGRLKPGISPAQVQSKVTVELQEWLNSGEGASTIGDGDHNRNESDPCLASTASLRSGVSVHKDPSVNWKSFRTKPVCTVYHGIRSRAYFFPIGRARWRAAPFWEGHLGDSPPGQTGTGRHCSFAIIDSSSFPVSFRSLILSWTFCSFTSAIWMIRCNSCEFPFSLPFAILATAE